LCHFFNFHTWSRKKVLTVLVIKVA
jgi:hypothetical protein